MKKGTFWLEEKPEGGVTIWIEDYEVEAFGGLGRIAEGQEYPVFDEREGRELVQRVRVYLPSRTALVLKREMV